MSWNDEFGTMLGYMGCDYYYNIELCDFDPAEDNYEDFCNWESTRQAITVTITISMTIPPARRSMWAALSTPTPATSTCP